MQKLLILVVGLLGITLVFMLGLLLWQRNTRPSLSSFPLSLSVSPVPASLPLSSQNKTGVRFVKLSDSYAKKGFVGWQDGEFFYMAKKGNSLSVDPFSFIGIVKKMDNRRLEIEAKGNDNKNYLVKVEQNPNIQIINKTKDTKIQLQTGNKVRVAGISNQQMKEGYFFVNIIYLLPS